MLFNTRTRPNDFLQIIPTFSTYSKDAPSSTSLPTSSNHAAAGTIATPRVSTEKSGECVAEDAVDVFPRELTDNGVDMDINQANATQGPSPARSAQVTDKCYHNNKTFQ